MTHQVEDGRCVVSDLPPDQCAGCKGVDLKDTWTVEDVTFHIPSKYESRLACGHRSTVGQSIYSVDEGWICGSCVLGL